MSTQTTNIGLIKDDETEFYNVGRVNTNLDIIDGEFKNVNGAVAAHETDMTAHGVDGKVSKAGDTMTGTLKGTVFEGTLTNAKGYLSIFPYAESYDDGSYIQSFYDGYDSQFILRGKNSDSSLKTVDINLNGNLVYHVGRKPTKVDVGLGSVDNLKQQNAIAIGSSSDPDTTQEPYILTNHTNSPGLGFWHIQTYFYANLTGNVAQIALPYSNDTNDMYIRRRYNSVWTAWTRLMTVEGGTFIGATSHGRNTVTQPKIKDYTEVVVTNIDVSGTKYIGLEYANVFKHTLNGNVSYLMNGVAPSGQSQSFTLIITQPATQYAITWFGGIKWVNGQIPDLPPANSTGIYTFFTVDGGGTWYGSQVGVF